MTKEQEKEMAEIEKAQAICYWLIHQCVETNADEMNLEYTNVRNNGKSLGDWKITVEKL